MNDRDKHVLVAPLDWGLGHATRCIPIIRELIRHRVKVTVCASGYGKTLLEERFPELPRADIPGIRVSYPAKGSMAVSMVLQLPAILSGIRREHEIAERIIAENKITHIISDNRYGLFSDKVKTAFMTHQVRIRGGAGFNFLEPVLFRMHQKRIEKFNELWIPDDPGTNLSGALSNVTGMDIPVSHTGILSRFQKQATASEKKYDCIALLSGPEPQRTIFEHKVMQFFTSGKSKCLLILGQPGNQITTHFENVTVMATISDNELSGLLHPDTLLICRPGYSTLMDLAILEHRKVVFVPTPGQTEQEYLADQLKKRFNYIVISQYEEFHGLQEINPGKKIPYHSDNELLKNAIGAFLI